MTDPQEPEAQTRHLPRDRSGDLLRRVLKRQAQQHAVPPEVQEQQQRELEKQKQRELEKQLEGQQKWVRQKEARAEKDRLDGIMAWYALHSKQNEKKKDERLPSTRQPDEASSSRADWPERIRERTAERKRARSRGPDDPSRGPDDLSRAPEGNER